jgi:hypothetical protein
MRWLKSTRRKNGHSAEKLIVETERLREQLTVTAERLEVFSGQLQNEVDRLHRIAVSPGKERKP